MLEFDHSLILIHKSFNPLTSPGEVVSVFTYPYLSAVAPALGEAKGLINHYFEIIIKFIYIYYFLFFFNLLKIFTNKK